MGAHKRLEAFGETDEPHGQRTVLQHLTHGIVPVELFGVEPHALPHEEGVIAHAAG